MRLSPVRSSRATLLAIGLCLVLMFINSPSAHASTSCSLSKDGRKLGTTYVTSLKVTAISCAGGKRVVEAFNACRRAHGGVRGKCTSVLGYRCTERRQSIPTQFSARARCSRASRVVLFSYTQFT